MSRGLAHRDEKCSTARQLSDQILTARLDFPSCGSGQSCIVGDYIWDDLYRVHVGNFCKIGNHVPFNFAVGNKQLPAGHYTFLTLSSYTLVIRNADYQFIILSRTENAGSVKGYSNRLVFHRYGDHYFLREIRCPSLAMNLELQQSKLEKQIRVQTASLGPETTLLAQN